VRDESSNRTATKMVQCANALNMGMNDLRLGRPRRSNPGVKQFAENLRLRDISAALLVGARDFSAADGISSQPAPHLTNLKAENETRILTGYPSDV
jgi:hypothetical protein